MFRSKYKNQPTVYNGVRYASKREARYAWELDCAIRSGDVLKWERQVRFELPAGIIYLLDFKAYWKDGSIQYVDVKGFRTPVYILKKKLVESIHRIKIVEA